MRNGNVFKQFACEAINAAQYEIEKCYYGKLLNQNDLALANKVTNIEQWEIRSPFGVMRVRAYDDFKYEFCIKKESKVSAGSKIEKEMDIDKELFLLIKSMCSCGTFKTRYEFNIPDSNLKWEVDVYKDKDNKVIEWVKVDLEIPSAETPVPQFPISLEGTFEERESNEEQKEFKKKLFNEQYNRYNADNIQVPYDSAELLDTKTLTVEEIAKLHGVGVSAILAQLAIGMEIESEHTSNPRLQKEITLDHLKEDPEYCSKIKQMESQ